MTVVGEGSQRRHLENLTNGLGLRNVEFIGRVEHSRMNEFYDHADIFMNGSEIDNMPGSIIEAFASGVPVVTTNAGGIPYIVSDEVTGLIAKSHSHEEIAALAIRILEDQELARSIISNARAECVKYSWDSVSQHWTRHYRELVAPGFDGKEDKSKSTIAELAN